MKKLLFILFLFAEIRALSQGNYQPVIATQYGSHMNRAKADSVQHIPRKYDTTINTIDTTPQIYSIGYNLWMYSKGLHHRMIDIKELADSLSVQGLQSVSHIGNTTDTTIITKYYNASYNPLDTSSIRKNTTINFVGDFASISLVGYAQALALYSGKPVLAYGISGETSPQILGRFTTLTTATPTLLTAYANIWEAGRNNLGNLTQMESDATAFANAMIASGNTKWAILSVFNASGENASAVGLNLQNYDTVIAFNAWAATTYTTHFLDSRTNAVNRYNSALAQDVIDHANDTPPLSLRQDVLHPNKYGADWIAYDLDTMAVLLGATKYVCYGNSFTQGSYYPYPGGYSVSINNRQRLYSSTEMFTAYKNLSWNYGGLTVINIGRPTDYYDTATVHHNVDSIVSYIGNDKYLILGLTLADTSTDIISGSRHNAVLGLNTTLATQYGSHFSNTLNLLLSHYNAGNPKDVADHANGVVPSSLKIDSAVLNTTGQAYIMTQVVSMLSTLRGTSNTALTTANVQDVLSSPPVIGATTPNLIVASRLSVGGSSAYAYPLNIQGADIGHMGINGVSMIYLPNQTLYSGSSFFGNGGFNLSSGAIQNTGLGIYTLSNNTTGYKNTAAGFQALAANTTGLQNSAFGNTALFNNIIGYDNTAIGNQVLYYNTTGIMLTGVGSGALLSNTTGYQNTGLGYRSLFLNTSGILNTASGFASLLNNTTGSANTAAGAQALDSNSTGQFNAAFGYLASYSALTNNFVTALGAKSLQNNKADGNTAGGYSSMFTNTTGGFNTALGYSANYYGQTGSFKTYVGYQAGYFDSLNSNSTGIGYAALKNNTADNSTGFGYLALFSNTTGSSNTGLGANALHSNTTGSFNTASGFNTLYNDTTGQFNTGHGYRPLFNNITGSQNTATGAEAMFTNSSGNDNTADGFRALYSNISGNDNTATGRQALYTNTGSNNTADGWLALFAHRTGNNNVAVGGQSMAADTAGAQNTSIGASSLLTELRGTSNSAMGYNVANGLTSGSQNTWIGANSTVGGDSSNSNRIGLLDGNNHMGFYGNALLGNFSIGSTTTTASALLSLPSTTKGFLPPLMTYAQWTAISSKVAGLQAFNTTTNSILYYDGTTTRRLYDSAAFVAGTGITITPTATALTIATTGGGSGTVTSFSAGTLSPLFTTSVATATTTPALTFSLSNAPAGSILNNNSTISAQPTYTTNPSISGNIDVLNYYSTSTTPGIVAGTGAGTSPTVSITGTNEGGNIVITTGTTPSGTGATIATITLSAGYAFPHGSSTILYPGNAATAALSGVTMPYIISNSSTWAIFSGTTGLTAATTYIWYYKNEGY